MSIESSWLLENVSDDVDANYGLVCGFSVKLVIACTHYYNLHLMVKSLQLFEISLIHHFLCILYNTCHFAEIAVLLHY